MHRYFNEKSHFLSLRDFLNAPCASRGGRATGVRPSISSARFAHARETPRPKLVSFVGSFLSLS